MHPQIIQVLRVKKKEEEDNSSTIRDDMRPTLIQVLFLPSPHIYCKKDLFWMCDSVSIK